MSDSGEIGAAAGAAWIRHYDGDRRNPWGLCRPPQAAVAAAAGLALVIDQSWLPAHPTPAPRTPRRGGNPQLNDMKTGDGTWGPYIEHAGARYETGFHGSFGCQAKGRGFAIYSETISA